MKTHIYLTHPDGRVMTVRGWAHVLAGPGRNAAPLEKRLRARMRQGWPDADVLTREMREGKWRGRTREAAIKPPEELAGALKRERDAARASGRKVPREMWDVPIERDPWAQCLAEVAREMGGFTLDEIGHVMGGLSRERVRQVEEQALRKADKIAKLRGHKGGIVELLQAAAAERDLRDDSEKGGYDG